MQIYTVAMREGVEAFSRIQRELESYMEENGIESVKEVIGAAQGEVRP